MNEAHKTFPIVIVGHVDHGKSTLIGRMLFDTGFLPPEKIKELRSISESLGKEIEFAYVMDHLEEERSQGMTIDTAQTFFKTEKRRYVIIDAPGHKEFLKNMLTGSSQADAAFLLIDASEGVREQTKRHCFLLGMFGIKQIAVLINKMDLVNYSDERFKTISNEITHIMKQLNAQSGNRANIEPSFIIPISAKNGDNIASKGKNLNWFEGPTILEALDSFGELRDINNSLRFPIQDIYAVNGKNIAVGRIESGMMKKGQELLILPEKEKTVLVSIEKFHEENVERSDTGECIGACFSKSVVRGKVLVSSSELSTVGINSKAGESLKQATRPQITQNIRANIFWMSDKPYHKEKRFTFKCSTQKVEGTIDRIYKRFDPATIAVVLEDVHEIGVAEIAEVNMKMDKPVVVDRFTDIPEMGRFVLEIEGCHVAGGIIL